MAGRKGAHALGPASNPRQGGGTPRQRQPGLMRNRTAAWRAELGLSSSIMGLFDSRSPLRLGEREPPHKGPMPHPRQGGVGSPG